jgi:hypothetical protein
VILTFFFNDDDHHLRGRSYRTLLHPMFGADPRAAREDKQAVLSQILDHMLRSHAPGIDAVRQVVIVIMIIIVIIIIIITIIIIIIITTTITIIYYRGRTSRPCSARYWTTCSAPTRQASTPFDRCMGDHHDQSL